MTATSSTLMSTFTVGGILTLCMLGNTSGFYSVIKQSFKNESDTLPDKMSLERVSLHFRSFPHSLFPCTLFSSHYLQKAIFISGYYHYNHIDSDNETLSSKYK